MTIKTFAIAAATLALLAAPAAHADAPQKVLALISAGDAEAAAFPLILVNTAIAQGVKARVVLCGAAGDAVLKTAPEAMTKVVTPTGMSVRALVEGVAKRGGEVSVCAIYLPNRGLKADALMEGVTVANPAEVTKAMLEPATRVVGP
jgi:predicted peroxiredoxin